MDKYEELWQKILYDLERVYNEDIYSEVFEPLKAVNCVKNGLVYVIVPNPFIKTRISQLYANKINDLALKYNNGEPIRFKFVLESEVPVDDDFTKKDKNLDKEGNKYKINAGLNAFYSFENFVVGDSNFFAFRMANLVADQIGTVANPLYIYGDVGLGKTHLMQAIGNYMIEKDVNVRVLYIKASEFVKDYGSLATAGKKEIFYDKYNDLDCLLVDDIQQLMTGDKSKDAFFNIYDRLFQNNKQIIITSDCPPANLKDIPARLTSRFQQGLNVDIGVPDFSHRVNILKKKIINEYPSDLVIPDDVVEFIAQHFPTNIRELDGALRRFVYYCLAHNLSFNIETANESLDGLLITKKVSASLSENSYDFIMSVVADYFHITISDLIGKIRKAEYVKARHVAMYLIKLNYDIPYKTIGDMFGGRDHSTVLAACNNIEHEINNDNTLKQAVEIISKKIKSRGK